MRRLYIVRHAKSSWKEEGQADFDRPLNKRGRKAAPEMGKRLRKQKVKPDLVLTSSAVRAVTTARAIADELAYAGEEIVTSDDMYGAGVDELLDIIRNTDDRVATLMIFGHNPGFTDLARSLTGEYIVNLATCAVYCVDFEGGTWPDVSRGSGTCSYYDFPKKEGQDS